MKLSDVIALIGAGYTKEEIEAFDKMESPQSTTPNPEVAPDPKPEVKPEQPKETAATINVGEQQTELLTAINGLTKALQLGNIRNTPQPNESAPAENWSDKADKALMEIYNL